jgi:hypothetical protein
LNINFFGKGTAAMRRLNFSGLSFLRLLLKSFVLLSLLVLTVSEASAGVKVFKGESGEKLYIESTNKPETFLVKLVGATTDWAGKVIQTRLTKGENHDIYTIDYEKKTGIGKGPKEYQMVVIDGLTLASGSIVKTASVYFPGGDYNHPLKMKYDETLTDAGQNVDLGADYKKAPFKPDFFKK